ncbi:MAG: 3-oxoacyl-ACP reductase FabG [Candidatus Rokubacteria bacterium]|nr:3-oxoacyl-ACP reductase FabG [Candidatus Rokubacteria bacterium]
MNEPGDLFSLSGRVALVTGGGRGIGRTIASALAGAGVHVAVCDVNAGEIEEEIGRWKPEGHLWLGDISRAEDVDRIVGEVTARLGAVEILVNNAGINIIKPAEEFGFEDWNRVLAINLTGTFLCAQRVGREMISRKIGGRIINISSVAAHIGPSMHGAVAYSAAKAGVLGMTRALAVEWAPHNILVNAVCPGMISTELTRSRLNDPAYRDKILQRVPLREIGTPLDVAGAVMFLASPAARLITGHALNVDGGWLAS